MRRILVPTDFSEEAQNAFEVAVAIAKQTGAAIKILHVIVMPRTANFSAMGSVVPADPNEQIFVIKLMESAHQQIRQMKAQAVSEGIDIVEEVDVDTIFNKINSVVEKDNVDLIVMGSKGSSGIREMLVGSNTEKVVQLAKAPVLTIKHKHAAFEVKNIVFPSDFQNEAESVKLKLAKQNRELPNPAAFAVVAKYPFPLEHSLLPIAKRTLVKYVSSMAA